MRHERILAAEPLPAQVFCPRSPDVLKSVSEKMGFIKTDKRLWGKKFGRVLNVVAKFISLRIELVS